MNLAWELRQGSLGRWCHQRLAHVADLDDTWQAAVRAGQTRRPRNAGGGGPDWRRLGAAIHWRIVFAFADQPPVTAFMGMAALDTTTLDELVEAYNQGRSAGVAPAQTGAANFAMRLGRFVAGYDLAATQPAKVERTLARAMWVLALWEDVHRAGPDAANWWPGPDAADWDGPAWLELAPDYAVTDLASVAELFTTRGRPGLVDTATSDDAIVGPVYVADWAEADLKLGTCLIDVKATVRPDRLDRRWIWQLCCYAWLDGHVPTIAIHLARQGRTVMFDLDDTVTIISGGDDPARLAGHAREIMTAAAASVGRQVL